jgi:hypothetical protein
MFHLEAFIYPLNLCSNGTYSQFSVGSYSAARRQNLNNLHLYLKVPESQHANQSLYSHSSVPFNYNKELIQSKIALGLSPLSAALLSRSLSPPKQVSIRWANQEHVT